LTKMLQTIVRRRLPSWGVHACFSSQSNGMARILMLNDIRDNPGARKTRKRVGRGQGSGLGKTCGKGHKGQGPRRSKPVRGFEGGQTPIWKRTPKRGQARNRNASPMNVLNLHKLQLWIEQQRLDPNQTITVRDIHMSNVCGKIKHGVKLLATGKEDFKHPVNLEVSRASQSAIAAIEAAGGRVTTVYYNRLGLRSHLMPHKFEQMPRLARPPPEIMPYYTAFENRGYLSPEMQLAALGDEYRDPLAAHAALNPPAQQSK